MAEGSQYADVSAEAPRRIVVEGSRLERSSDGRGDLRAYSDAGQRLSVYRPDVPGAGCQQQYIIVLRFSLRRVVQFLRFLLRRRRGRLWWLWKLVSVPSNS